jgi:hypothetical protein
MVLNSLAMIRRRRGVEGSWYSYTILTILGTLKVLGSEGEDDLGNSDNFLTERIVYFLSTVQCYNILEIYYCYEIQKHRAL